MAAMLRGKLGSWESTFLSVAIVYYILPLLVKGKNVLIVAHGNSMRALIKYIENISDKDIVSLEFEFGEVIFYDFDESGKMVKKEIKRA